VKAIRKTEILPPDSQPLGQKSNHGPPKTWNGV